MILGIVSLCEREKNERNSWIKIKKNRHEIQINLEFFNNLFDIWTQLNYPLKIIGLTFLKVKYNYLYKQANY